MWQLVRVVLLATLAGTAGAYIFMLVLGDAMPEAGTISVLIAVVIAYPVSVLLTMRFLERR